MEWYLLHFLACWDCLSTSLLITAFILRRLLRGFHVLHKQYCLANIGVIGEDWTASTLAGSESQSSCHSHSSFSFQGLFHGTGIQADWLRAEGVSLNSRWCSLKVQPCLWAYEPISVEQIIKIKSAPSTDPFHFHTPLYLILSFTTSLSILLNNISLVIVGISSQPYPSLGELTSNHLVDSL